MTPFTVPPRRVLHWAAVDLDGTLAESVWPDPGIGAPISENVAKVRQLAKGGYKVVIHTSRGWSDCEMIEGWLVAHNVPFHRVECGKVLAAIYVDDRNVLPEADSWFRG